MKKTNTNTALNAFLTTHNHTLNTQEIISLTGCMSPSHLVKYLARSRKCVFSKNRLTQNNTEYTLINHSDYQIMGEV